MWDGTKRFLDRVGLAHTVYGLATTEFARTALWPTVWAMLAGGSGVLGGLPMMYVIATTAFTFAAVMQGLLRGSEYRERKSPMNKLSYVGTVFARDLTPAPMPVVGSRHDRRAQRAQRRNQEQQMLAPHQIVLGVQRTMAKGQIGIEIRNNATFPISCRIESAKSELKAEGDVEELKPPRGDFPKAPVLITAGATMAFFDDAMDMEETPCGRLTGKLCMVLKYGLPGKEYNELRFDGEIIVMMENFGFVSGVQTSWLS